LCIVDSCLTINKKHHPYSFTKIRKPAISHTSKKTGWEWGDRIQKIENGGKSRKAECSLWRQPQYLFTHIWRNAVISSLTPSLWVVKVRVGGLTCISHKYRHEIVKSGVSYNIARISYNFRCGIAGNTD